MVTNSFGNRNCMQPMGRLNMHSWRALVFFFLDGGWGPAWGTWLLFFFLVQSLPLANSFGNQKYMQPMGRLKDALKVPNCFSFKFWVGGGVGGRISFIFPLFQTASFYVPFKFSSGSQRSPCVPQGCSQWHLALIQYSSPSRLYRWSKGGANPSFNRIVYFGGASIVSTFFFDQPIKITHRKKTVALVRHPPLININHTTPR
jgi:hypothetical protein